MPIFCRKNVHPLNNTVLHVICTKFFMKKPLLSCPYLVKMRQFCQTYTILWAIKVNKIPFFRFFHEKINALMHIFCKKGPFSKKHAALMSIFCQKTSILSETLCSHVIFFNFLMKNPLLPCPYFIKKNQFCQNNIVWIMGQKSQWDAFFLPFFMKKSLLSCPYFVNITLRSQK